MSDDAPLTRTRSQVERIMLAPNESYCITSLGALREVSALSNKGNMSKTQAEIVLGSFVAKGWLLRSRFEKTSLVAWLDLNVLLAKDDIRSRRVLFLN